MTDNRKLFPTFAKWKSRLLTLGVSAAACLLFSSCGFAKAEETKIRDLEFVVLSEERIPGELQTILSEKKAEPFQITYKDMDNLYICVGYGEKQTGGYSIAVDSLYLTDTSIHAETILIGPDASKKPTQTTSYPMIVVRTEYLEDPVVFD